MPHNIVNGFCESGCKVPVKPSEQIEDTLHGGTGLSVKTLDELKRALGIIVDTKVTEDGSYAVSGAAVTAYFEQELAKIADYDSEVL